MRSRVVRSWSRVKWIVQTLTLASLVVVVEVAPARSTTINLPTIVNILLPNVFASTVGTSTDGANFTDVQTGPPRAIAVGAAAGALGSFNSGAADADVTNPLVPLVSTIASAIAGVGQTAAVISIAKAGDQLSFSAQFDGVINFEIDPPFMRGVGSAQDEMGFVALLNGSTIFSADAKLNNGSLTTSGAFTSADFTVTSVSGQTLAQLTNDAFVAPIHISASEVGQVMTFEFDQTFTANSQNGGTAVVANLPEPSSLLVLATGVIGVLLARRKPDGNIRN